MEKELTAEEKKKKLEELSEKLVSEYDSHLNEMDVIEGGMEAVYEDLRDYVSKDEAEKYMNRIRERYGELLFRKIFADILKEAEK